MSTLYTLRKCKRNRENLKLLIGCALVGPSHGADDDKTTLCGQKIDSMWYITNNTCDGEITCKKCKKIAETTTIPQRAIARRNT